MPIVSIMMPAYNAEKYIRQAVESVLSQKFQEWQLVIVNDGSTDATQEILGQYTEPRIRVFYQSNGGEASARNQALNHIDTELIAFLDADDCYLPDHLDVTIGYLMEHPESDGVYTDGYYCDQDGVRMKSLSSRRRGLYEGDIFEQMVRASDVFGAPVCVVLRRELIVKHNLVFDPEIIIGPDWDFLTKYSEEAQFGNINEPTCLYRIHASNISTRTKQADRIRSLVKCRKNAINLSRFGDCSLPTRWYVFYDLLVNLLVGNFEQQHEIIKLPEFKQLPPKERSHLIRLITRKEILRGSEFAVINEWFSDLRKACPEDKRSKLLETLYRFSPGLTRKTLELFSGKENELEFSLPFSDLA